MVEHITFEYNRTMNTVRDAIALCGVNNIQVWNGRTKTQRIAAHIFNDDFESARDLDYDNVLDDFKSYSNLTVTNGQICLNTGSKRNIRAFIQWNKHMFCLGTNPATVAFPVANSSVLLCQEQSHIQFFKRRR